ncbi:MAG: IS66 family transposase [Spirochaetales bacterium]|nr:IS66 family transposase [Spirochaetales bacterium]
MTIKNKGNDEIEKLREQNKALQREINIITADLGYWKKQHERAIEREQKLKTELADKNARIKYLEHRLYAKKTEKSKRKTKTIITPGKRGRQKGIPNHSFRKHNQLPVKDEIYEATEPIICPKCGKPYKELKSTEDTELVEIEVKGYKRKIKRKKYAQTCKCEIKKGIITALGPVKLFPGTHYGMSIWIFILLKKYRFQIPVARVLKELQLYDVDVPAGTVGDGLKRMPPLFEPIYEALEERSRQSDWWQADETHWSVFEMTKSKTSYRWYLWVFISTESIVYIMDPTRAAVVIEEHLGVIIEGILLVDRYSAYKSYAKKHTGIILAFCWSHVRRDFTDAGKKYPAIKEWTLIWEERINRIFHLNNLRTQYPGGTREFLHEDKQIREALDIMYNVALEELKLPRLHYAQKGALKSLINHWEGLIVFVEHPFIPMDNNGSERILRGPAVGRKNYYGSGAIWSGRFTAIMFSIFETLQMWKINQHTWLMDYLTACGKAGGKAPGDVTPFLPWQIKEKNEPGKMYCGRVFSKADIECIRAIIDEDTSRNRTIVSRIACQYLRWYKPDGGLKERSMRVALLKMERDGEITLPVSQKSHPGTPYPIRHTQRTAPGQDIIAPAGELAPLNIRVVQNKEEHSLWNEYIDRYHYLGYTSLPGAYLKYAVYAKDELLALLGFGASAWRIADRDAYIGWSDEMRMRNLHLVINNARFLILPWIYSKNLASMILAMIVRRIADDWEKRYNYRPVLLETFVEKERFAGSCYRAANWQYVGTTKGRGKKDRYNQAVLPKKMILTYPLQKNFRPLLC